MKTLAITLSYLLAFFLVNGQTLLFEDFSENQMPPNGWQISSHSTNWSINLSNIAGGDIPEAKLSWAPQFNGSTRLITPPLDLSNYNGIIYFKFNYSVDDYSGGYTLKAEVKSNVDDWQTIWTKNVNGSIPAQTIFAQMPALQDSTSVQFALVFEGNSYNINYWYIDNIEVFNSTPLDLEITKVLYQPYIQGDTNTNFSLILTNKGQDTINSFDISFEGGNQTVTENITNINLQPMQSYTYTFSQPYHILVGENNLTFYISNINGGADSVSANDTMNISFSGASKSVPNVPLYEEFTSSTCSPCANFNGNIFNPFLASHPDVTCIKYQMNWPGNGDPYYTEEGGIRRMYYGVSYVPWLEAGGKQYDNSASGVNQSYIDLTSKPSFINLQAHYYVDSPFVNVWVDIMPYINLDNVSLRIAVVEDTTTGNVGTNGETEFYHVMMKMVPDAYGTPISLQDSVEQFFYFTQDMSGTNVEEYSDLSVVVFLQYENNKDVLQSCWAQNSFPIPKVTYNIAQNTQVNPDTFIIATFNTPMRFTNDTEITNDNAASIFTLKTSDNQDINFTVQVNDNKTQFTIIPTNGLPSGATINLYIPADVVENYQDQSFEGDTLTFYTETAFSNFKNEIRVYPNPAQNFVFIENAQNWNYYLVDAQGKIIRQGIFYSNKSELNLKNVSSGLFYLQLRKGNKIKKFKLIKN